jgi:hypothetical protein
MTKSTWTGAVNSDWDDPDNWNPADVPGADSDVTIATADAVASASIGTVDSITDSADLSFESAGTNTVGAFLDNTGSLNVDDSAGAGGTVLNIGGTLTNSGSFSIGDTTLSASDEVTAAALDNTGQIHLRGSGVDQALLDVTGRAGFGSASVVAGDVRVDGDSAIEFASGEITSLATDAQLHLNGKDAFIEDSTALGSNSALTRLDSIGAGATFGLHNRAAVSTTGSLVNKGHIRLDFDGGDGGSSLTLAGALTNSGSLSIGNTTLSGSDKVTASSLDNKGSISLAGSSANQALLDVTTGVAGFGTMGVLSGNVGLAGDSAIEFGSGEITSLARGAHLDLNGSDAFIEDSTALGSNSALTGLALIDYGDSFALHDHVAVSTSGALVNDGTINLDANTFDRGGSSLTLAGALTNIGTLGIGNNALSAPDKVTAASLDNTGLILLTGSGDTQALLDVTGSAGFGTVGVLSGVVGLSRDSAIEFASGQITSLTGSLAINGRAFIEDSTALGSNSALTGLASIGAAATLTLEDSPSVSTTGALVNHGGVDLEDFASLSTTGGLANDGTITLDTDAHDGDSSLTLTGTLTNSGSLSIGNADLSESDRVTAASLDNTGSINLLGTIYLTAQALLNVSGPTTNNGSISITDDTEELAGAVSGSGSFSLSTADLQFGASVSAGQTITALDNGGDEVTLKQAQNFAATISGFGTGDTIDATNFLLSGTTFNFVENSGGTGGTLTLHDGSLTANILMTGDYSKASFTLAPDSGTGTLVKFV